MPSLTPRLARRGGCVRAEIEQAGILVRENREKSAGFPPHFKHIEVFKPLPENALSTWFILVNSPPTLQESRVAKSPRNKNCE